MVGRTDWERQLIQVIRRRNFSWRTEETYRGWAIRFSRFISPSLVADAGTGEVKAFLDYLAVTQRVAASTQRQALNAIVFLLREALGKPLGDFSDFTKSSRPRRLPEVLSPDECRRLFSEMTGTFRLMAELMYGSGLRLMELLRLRIKDADLDRGQLVVRAGKG